MNKLILSVLSVFISASIANAENYIRKATVTAIEPIYETVFVDKPATKCENVQVPIYGTRQRESNAAGGALLGMIIGGAVGKGLTGKNDGAAVGAVMGGIIGADQGSKPKSDKIVIGYETKKHCYETFIAQEIQKLTSHKITYTWSGLVGTFYSLDAPEVGDSIEINVIIAAI